MSTYRQEEKNPEVVMPACPSQRLLQGQKALVTGANSGIGKAVAIALGQAGAEVVINYVKGEAEANEVVAAIRRSGSSAYAHQADVSREDQVRSMFQRMLQEFGSSNSHFGFCRVFCTCSQVQPA